MNIFERIRKIRQECDLTIFQLSDKIGIPNRTISNYERGERKPSVEYLTLLYEHLNANPEWLLSGRGEMFTDKEKTSLQAKVSADEFTFYQKMNLDAAAGYGAIAEDEEIEDYIAFKKDWANKHISSPKNAIRVLTAKGDSMEPTIKNGDLLLVDISQSEAKSDNIYVLRIDHSLVVKRIQRLPGNKLQVISDNKNYEPYVVDLSDESQETVIIGKVLWYGRQIESF